MYLRTIYTILIGIIILGCKEVKNNQANEVTPKIVKEKNSVATYEDLNGNAIKLTDYKGKRVLLNYWATWCRPCIEEMPDMEKLQGKLAEENYVFLFASDQSIEKIIDFKEKRKFQLEFIKFNGMYADENISALPTTFIYNEIGEQVQRIEGSIKWNSPEMIDKLREIH